MSKELVEAVKNDLVARGFNLTGPCGAFEITKRVAWILKGDGIGLHRQTPGRNGCDWNGGYFSIDGLIYRDGPGIDCLGDGGGANTPLWTEEPDWDPDRWVAPMDPGDVTVPPEPPEPPVPGPGPDPDCCARVEEQLHLLIAQVHNNAVDVQAQLDQIQHTLALLTSATSNHTAQLTDIINRLHELRQTQVTMAYSGPFSFGTIRLTPRP